MSLIKIPAKSVINMVGVYGNTATNPSNPNTPPRFVYSSGNMHAMDEMFTMLMIYVPCNEGNEKVNAE